MANIPASIPREEWSDSDFDLPENGRLQASDPEPDKENEDEDWDIEMDLGKTGGAKAQGIIGGPSVDPTYSSNTPPEVIMIRPPIINTDDEEEGVSTIKAPALPISPIKSAAEDFEDSFALPSDLTKLSLAPLSLNHKSSKQSLEWGDKDQTSSSQCSDSYSSLGFGDVSISSNSASSVERSNSDTDDEDEDEVEGVVIPTDLFDSATAGHKLLKQLEKQRQTRSSTLESKVSNNNPEDDFETGLIIDNDVELSPSRLRSNVQQIQPSTKAKRSESLPSQPHSHPHPSPRPRERARSPPHPPISSTRHLHKLRLSPSPPLRPIRSQSFQTITSAPALPPSSPFSTKPGSLRSQKSHSGLKTTLSPPPNFTRKASLSSLIEANQTRTTPHMHSSYRTPTTTSLAKGKPAFVVPPTRPSTPSKNTAALRLSMPTSTGRNKSRPSLTSIFPSPSLPTPARISPLQALSHLPVQHDPSPSRASLPTVHLKKPKRQRVYGDGTELDGIDDLPIDREKERCYRVQSKGKAHRSLGSQSPDTPNASRRGKFWIGQDPLPTSGENTQAEPASRVDSPESLRKKRKAGNVPKKPTLIRNLTKPTTAKVVGGMQWNPKSLRWEGNEQVLRDFDTAVGTSSRPALITHLSGSSLGSPVSAFAVGARKVGNMIFDPARMCWMSTLPPEEEEPDVFANMADDEDDGSWAKIKGATATPSYLDTSLSTGSSSYRPCLGCEPTSHGRGFSDSGSERGSRPWIPSGVDDILKANCRLAEERHRAEMRGWCLPHTHSTSSAPDRSGLYDIRTLAARQYSKPNS